MPERLTPDICIIGAGSGGLTAAAAAAAFGAEVVLIERGRMGGDCLNHGCVPSKALIAAARHAHAIGEAPRFGIYAAGFTTAFAEVRAHIESVIATIAPNDSAERFEAMGVRVLKESAAFRDPRTVVAGDFEIRARRFVIATGSRPAIPPIPGLDTIAYLTNETLFGQSERPEHLLIIGGGPFGMEMAQAYRRLGSAVTVVEAKHALGNDDPELAAVIVDRLKSEGVRLLEQTTVVAAAADAGGIRLVCEGGGKRFAVAGTTLLVATGRVPNVDGLDLDKARVAHDPRGIRTGAGLRTGNRRVYAIGDVAGGPQFTHVAGYQAGLAVQQILFRIPAREKRTALPRATYTDPELAHVGLTEAEARQRHRRIAVLRWPFSENDRGRIERQTDGLIKIVTTAKGRILGASIAGPAAGEMIGLWALAVSKGLTVADLRGCVLPYPTLSEIGKRAALTYYNPLTRRASVRRIVRLLRRFG